MALIFHLDASNPASWPYAPGAAPSNVASWTDVSGHAYSPSTGGGYPDKMTIYNNPDLVTISGSKKGLRMRATSGGTYPNGTAIHQRGYMDLGGDPTTPLVNDIGRQLTVSKSYSISMWICFNQAPISGSSGTNLPTTIFAQQVNPSPNLVLSANRGDSVNPRGSAQIAVRYDTPSPDRSVVAGAWAPTVGVWYLVTIVAENTSPSSGNLSLYINDVLQGTGTITGSSYVPFNLPRANYFKYYFVLNQSYYANALPNTASYGGDITYSTFKIFDTALSSAEIATEFNGVSNDYGYYPPPPTPDLPVPQPSILVPPRLPNAMYNPNVWRTRSRGGRWVVPARDDYRTSNGGLVTTTIYALFNVPEATSIINDGEFGGFVIGDQTETFTATSNSLTGQAALTLGAATNTATGTIT